MIYDSVSADLATQFLESIPGSLIEEKLLFLQDQLGENFPHIVIQYICGDDTSIVQIKGQWCDVKSIHNLLDQGIEILTQDGKLQAPDKVQNEASVGKIGDSSFESHPKESENLLSSKKASVKIKTENDNETEILDEKDVNLCEYCGQACRKCLPDPETKNIAVQTDGHTKGKGKEVHSEKSGVTRTISGRVVKPTFKVQQEKIQVIQPESENFPDENMHLDLADYIVNTTDNEDGQMETSIVYDESGVHLVARDNADKVETKEEKDSDDDDSDEQSEGNDDTDEEENEKDGKYMLLTDIPEIVCEAPKPKDKTISDYEEGEEPMGLLEISPHEPIITGSARGRKRKSDIFGEGKMITISQVKELISEIMTKIGGDKMEGKVDIPCSLCDYKTNAKRHLRAHILRCHVPQTNKCYVCGKMYSLPKDLRFHLKSHFPEHTCVQCERRFPSKTILQQHIEKYHNAEKEKKRALKGMVQKCEHCDYTNEHMKNIKDHVARHHQEKSFACDRCPKKFALKKDLATHEKAHDARFECEECGKILRSKIALKAHNNSIHLGIKNIQRKEHMCDHCGFICRSKTHYNEHVNKEHLNVKPFGCPLCKMAFYTNAALRSHLSTHTDARKFTCTVCNKLFKHKTSLKMHEATHLTYKSRPFECQTCKKSFSQKGALMRHTRIHTGEKPYKCRLCESAFSDYSILRRHMLGVHKVNSKHMCQRKDITGNKGGPKPEKTIVDDIDQYKHVVRTPAEQEEENQEDENLLAMVTKSALEAQNTLSNPEKTPRFQPIRPRTTIIDAAGNTIQIELPGNHSELDDLKGIQPMNIVPISTVEGNETHISDSIYINPPTGSSGDIHEYFVAEVNPQISQELGGYTVLHSGTGGLSSVSNVVSDFVGSGMASLPFTVQTIPSQDGEPIAIQIIQSSVQQ